MNLFLDDNRTPFQVHARSLNAAYINTDWKVVKNYDEFVLAMETLWNDVKALPKRISFDHDLGDVKPGEPESTEKTGYHCFIWLSEFCFDKHLELPICWIHSMNPVGRQKIEKAISAFRIVRAKQAIEDKVKNQENS
jgi:hypothetical protein